MADTSKVALITGGASGMGLAVARMLSTTGWNVGIIDLNKEQAKSAIDELGPSATFAVADVSKFDEQLAAFEHIRRKFGGIDFVFANAGVIGQGDFYEECQTWPPSAPSMLVQEICLTGVVYTSYLAMHFMRQNSPPSGVLVMTASAASLYATPDLPIYTSSKHGVLGLMRSLSARLRIENIRVNCILPGAIKTSLHSDETWSQFARDDFTPIEEIVDVTIKLLNNPYANGRAMEISKGEVFDRAQPEFSNETMRRIMTSSTY